MSTLLVPPHCSVAQSAGRALGVDTRRPVFICGVGRSGTSLLHSMLNAHPDLSLPPETHFFRRYVARARTRRAFEGGTLNGAARALAADEDLGRAHVPLQELLVAERDGALDMSRVFERLLELVALRQGKTRVGDKDPRSIDHLPALARSFPEAFVIHVIRDPREVLLSRTRAAWSASRPWWQHALLAEDQLRIGRSDGPLHFGAHYLEVRYEDLVTEPEQVLRRVTHHLGMEYSAAMLDYSSSAASLVDPREHSWKKETLGPLLSGNREKWRTELDPARIQFVERIGREAFDRVGYVRSTGTRALRVISPMLRSVARAVFAARRAAEGLR